MSSTSLSLPSFPPSILGDTYNSTCLFAQMCKLQFDHINIPQMTTLMVSKSDPENWSECFKAQNSHGSPLACCCVGALLGTSCRARSVIRWTGCQGIVTAAIACQSESLNTAQSFIKEVERKFLDFCSRLPNVRKIQFWKLFFLPEDLILFH